MKNLSDIVSGIFLTYILSFLQYIRHAFWLFLADVYMNILSDIVSGIFLTYILIFYQAVVLAVYPTRNLALSSQRIYEHSICHVRIYIERRDRD